jgi:hypothetical protein
VMRGEAPLEERCRYIGFFLLMSFLRFNESGG